MPALHDNDVTVTQF